MKNKEIKNEGGNGPVQSVERKRRRLYQPLAESATEGKTPVDQPKNTIRIDKQPVLIPADRGSQKFEEAVRIVKRHSRYAATIGLVPLPFAEMVMLFSMQLKMLRKLCIHYNVPFSADLGKGLIASLASSLNIGLLGGSILKAVPIIGLSIAVATTATLSMALTYAVGMVFAKHFELGGTLLDFNIKKKRKAFVAEYTDKVH